MAHSLDVPRRFEKDFRKLPLDIKHAVSTPKQERWIPIRFWGKGLRGEFEGSHNFSIGDYRLIYRVIMSEKRVILIDRRSQTQSIQLVVRQLSNTV